MVGRACARNAFRPSACRRAQGSSPPPSMARRSLPDLELVVGPISKLLRQIWAGLPRDERAGRRLRCRTRLLRPCGNCRRAKWPSLRCETWRWRRKLCKPRSRCRKPLGKNRAALPEKPAGDRRQYDPLFPLPPGTPPPMEPAGRDSAPVFLLFRGRHPEKTVIFKTFSAESKAELSSTRAPTFRSLTCIRTRKEGLLF
jgi:hypothetical protein